MDRENHDGNRTNKNQGGRKEKEQRDAEQSNQGGPQNNPPVQPFGAQPPNNQPRWPLHQDAMADPRKHLGSARVRRMGGQRPPRLHNPRQNDLNPGVPVFVPGNPGQPHAQSAAATAKAPPAPQTYPRLKSNLDLNRQTVNLANAPNRLGNEPRAPYSISNPNQPPPNYYNAPPQAISPQKMLRMVPPPNFHQPPPSVNNTTKASVQSSSQSAGLPNTNVVSNSNDSYHSSSRQERLSSMVQAGMRHAFNYLQAHQGSIPGSQPPTQNNHPQVSIPTPRIPPPNGPVPMIAANVDSQPLNKFKPHLVPSVPRQLQNVPNANSSVASMNQEGKCLANNVQPRPTLIPHQVEYVSMRAHTPQQLNTPGSIPSVLQPAPHSTVSNTPPFSQKSDPSRPLFVNVDPVSTNVVSATPIRNYPYVGTDPVPTNVVSATPIRNYPYVGTDPVPTNVVSATPVRNYPYVDTGVGLASSNMPGLVQMNPYGANAMPPFSNIYGPYQQFPYQQVQHPNNTYMVPDPQQPVLVYPNLMMSTVSQNAGVMYPIVQQSNTDSLQQSRYYFPQSQNAEQSVQPNANEHCTANSEMATYLPSNPPSMPTNVAPVMNIDQNAAAPLPDPNVPTMSSNSQNLATTSDRKIVSDYVQNKPVVMTDVGRNNSVCPIDHTQSNQNQEYSSNVVSHEQNSSNPMLVGPVRREDAGVIQHGRSFKRNRLTIPHPPSNSSTQQSSVAPEERRPNVAGLPILQLQHNPLVDTNSMENIRNQNSLPFQQNYPLGHRSIDSQSNAELSSNIGRTGVPAIDDEVRQSSPQFNSMTQLNIAALLELQRMDSNSLEMGEQESEISQDSLIWGNSLNEAAASQQKRDFDPIISRPRHVSTANSTGNSGSFYQDGVGARPKENLRPAAFKTATRNDAKLTTDFNRMGQTASYQRHHLHSQSFPTPPPHQIPPDFSGNIGAFQETLGGEQNPSSRYSDILKKAAGQESKDQNTNVEQRKDKTEEKLHQDGGHSNRGFAHGNWPNPRDANHYRQGGGSWNNQQQTFHMSQQRESSAAYAQGTPFLNTYYENTHFMPMGRPNVMQPHYDMEVEAPRNEPSDNPERTENESHLNPTPSTANESNPAESETHGERVLPRQNFSVGLPEGVEQSVGRTEVSDNTPLPSSVKDDSQNNVECVNEKGAAPDAGAVGGQDSPAKDGKGKDDECDKNSNGNFPGKRGQGNNRGKSDNFKTYGKQRSLGTHETSGNTNTDVDHIQTTRCEPNVNSPGNVNASNISLDSGLGSAGASPADMSPGGAPSDAEASLPPRRSPFKKPRSLFHNAVGGVQMRNVGVLESVGESTNQEVPDGAYQNDAGASSQATGEGRDRGQTVSKGNRTPANAESSTVEGEKENSPSPSPTKPDSGGRGRGRGRGRGQGQGRKPSGGGGKKANRGGRKK